MLRPDAWVARLACGHDARLPGRPPAGGYITCTDGRCQGQRRVASVRAAPAVMVMDPMFGPEDCHAA